RRDHDHGGGDGGSVPEGHSRLFGVDRAASCESFFQSVPESNVVLAELPAQKDLLSFTLRGEVDEPFVEVLDDRAAAVDVVDAAPDSDPLALGFEIGRAHV